MLQRWGRALKPVRDPQVRQVVVQRYRCATCGRTFRWYPAGVTAADQSARLMMLAAVAWALGLSLRCVALLFPAFGVAVSRMTVWRDVQALAQATVARPYQGRVRVLGVDGTGIRCRGETVGVVVAVDLGTGQPLAVELLDERDPQAVQAWLAPLVQQWGVEVLVTDDLASYRGIADRLGVQHQVCWFHLRRWVGRTLRNLRHTLDPAWHDALQQVDRLVQDLPPDGDHQLFHLWRRIPARSPPRGVPRPPLYQFKQLVLRLSQTWPRYRLAHATSTLPRTNNRTEQAIGQIKVRSRTVRGYKRPASLAPTLLLCARRGG